MGEIMYKETHKLQMAHLHEGFNPGDFNMLFAHHTVILRWENSSEVI